MRCNSPMVYQWNAKSLYWYQSHHWYQWTNGIQPYSNRTVAENSLSPLNEMQLTNGVPMECQVTLLVPIVPLVPMDERNPAVLQLNCSENSLSPLNEMEFTNGVPMECQVTLLVPIVPLVPMDERNPAVLKPNCSENSLSPLNEMQFTNGVPMECQSIPLDSVCVYWTTLTQKHSGFLGRAYRVDSLLIP